MRTIHPETVERNLLGPYEEGSLRPVDVAEAYGNILSAIAAEWESENPNSPRPEPLYTLAARIRESAESYESDPFGPEAFEGDRTECELVAADYLPEGYCIGSHPDDPACIGIWRTELFSDNA